MEALEFEQICSQEFSGCLHNSSCGYEINLLWTDEQNSPTYNRGISLMYDVRAGFSLWKYSRGCFNGYGSTLQQAKEEVNDRVLGVNEPETVQAFLV